MDFSADGPRIERSENSHRHNRRARFCDHQPQTSQGRLQISIRRARPFRKNERAIASAQNSDQRLERATIVSFDVDWDDVELGQEPTENGRLHQRFLREKIDSTVAGVAGEWWVKKTLVIHSEDHRTGLNHPLAMNYAESKKQSRKQTRKVIAEPIVRVHTGAALKRQSLPLQLFDDFIDHLLNCEVGSIDHLSIRRDSKRRSLA